MLFMEDGHLFELGQKFKLAKYNLVRFQYGGLVQYSFK